MKGMVRGLKDDKKDGENEDKEGVERLGGMGTAKNLRSQTIIKEEEEELYAIYYILYGVVRVYRMKRRRRVKMKKEDGENEDKDGVERLGGMGTAKN